MTLDKLMRQLVADDRLHARWLNTLSLLENTGARKIAAAEDAATVDLLMLKHAAEEARHAYYLKQQLKKLGADTALPTYEAAYLLAPVASRAYLNRLDTQLCRYLKTDLGLTGKALRYAAYLLVTYAIEVRADELYPVYQDVLTDVGSRVTVRSIIVEEEGHLAEMLRQMQTFFGDYAPHADRAVAIERALFDAWLGALVGGVMVQVSHEPLEV